MSLAPLSTVQAVLAKRSRLTHITASSAIFSNPQWDTQLQLLTLDFALLPEQVATLILTGWERGIEVLLVLNNELEIHDNPFAASLLPIEFFDKPLLQDWVNTIPVEVLKTLRCFAINPIGFLQIISRDGAAFELFLDHPVLFTLLYQETLKRRQDLPWFLLHCRTKRVQCLLACGLPAEPSAVKVLKKLRFQRFTRRDSERIQLLFTLDYALLNHLSCVSASLLRAVIKHPLVLNSGLLSNWQEADAQSLQELLEDIQRLRRHRFIAQGRLFEPLKRCRNLADVLRLHDRLVEVINRHAPENKDAQATFPEPPLAGNSAIIPITTYAELRLEGKQQRHCVVSYADDILNGGYYVYRVLTPERATLGLRLVYQGKTTGIVLEQLKGQGNREVNAATLQAVESWLLSHRMSR